MSRSLTKLFAAFILVAGFALSAFAQDESNIIRPITKSGSAAFVFNISGLGAFGPAAQPIGTVSDGSTSQAVAGAGLKYYLSDDLAAKILLAFAMTDNGIDADKGTNITATQLGIGAIIEVHFGPLYSTSPYAGGGIHFASGSATSKATVGSTTTESSASGTQITIMGVAGFDWFFTRGIAIGAEWGLGYTMNSSSSKVAGTSTDGPSPTSIGIGMTGTNGISGSGSVHAVVYF
jgi:outer membrane protein with beta-barrel domain